MVSNERKSMFVEILTEGFELIEADGALSIGSLDATGVENVVTLEQPHLLFVPLHVELNLAEVAAVLFDANALRGQLV